MGIFKQKSNHNKRKGNNVESEVEYVSDQSNRADENTEKEILTGDMSDLKFPTGDKSKDLMVLVGKALNEWKKMYNLQGMPTKIVFGQALALMTAWYKDMK